MAELDESGTHFGAEEHPAEDEDGDDRRLGVRGAEEGGEESCFEEHGFPAEAEEFLANVHDGEIEDVEDEPCGNGESNRAALGETEESEDGEDEAGPGDDVDEAVGEVQVEEARSFAPGGVAEEDRDWKQAAFAEERFELADYGEEGDKVDGGHSALDEYTGEVEVAEVVVERGHSLDSKRLDEDGSS